MSTPARVTNPIIKTIQNNVPPRTLERLRSHPQSYDLKGGWTCLNDRNVVGNHVLLISQHSPVVVSFAHAEPYHAHLRATIEAMVYAQENPQRSVTEGMSAPVGADTEVDVPAEMPGM